MLRLAQTPHPLRAPEFLALTSVWAYQIIETDEPGAQWEVRGLGYWIGLHGADHEILAYHWHPLTPGGPTFPHLHLSAGAGRLLPRLTIAHLPTGLVHLEDVLPLAIETFGARPLHRDWDDVLTTSKAQAITAWT